MISWANLFCPEYFYMNVLSADLPGVKRKPYSFLHLFICFKRQLASILRVVRNMQNSNRAACGSSLKSAQVGPKYPVKQEVLTLLIVYHRLVAANKR